MSDVSLGRKAVVGLFAFLSVISLGVGIAVILGFSGNATSSDLKQSTERTDCRSAYNADFTQVRDARADAKDDVDAFYDNAQLKYAQTGAGPTDQDLQDFAALVATWEKARAAVKNLPKLNVAVDNGYTLNGVSHPPCPK